MMQRRMWYKETGLGQAAPCVERISQDVVHHLLIFVTVRKSVTACPQTPGEGEPQALAISTSRHRGGPISACRGNNPSSVIFVPPVHGVDTRVLVDGTAISLAPLHCRRPRMNPIASVRRAR